MCGRIATTLPHDAMATLFGATLANDMPPIPNFNLCPTQALAAVSLQNGARHISAMRWGFLPHWYKAPNDGPLLINARAETIAEKPAFREACRTRRCILPISGFYEWFRDGQTKLPWYVQMRDQSPMALAGIWQDWQQGGESIRSCAVVTCAANESMAEIHHRMPVILAQEDWGLWLGEEGRGAARLMTPADDALLTLHRVGAAVNSNRATGPALIEPIEDEPLRTTP